MLRTGIFGANDVGLRLDHELKLDEHWTQHRFDAHDSVIKINEYRKPLSQQAPSGYRELIIAHDKETSWEGRHPGGENIRLVPKGSDGIVGIGITVTTEDRDRLMAFYIEAMQFEHVDDYVARCGDSLLFVEHGPSGIKTNSFYRL